MSEGKKLEIKNVSKVFPQGDNSLEVLKDINVTVNPGEFVSIVGASGCGKSTLIRIIAGLETATCGQVLLNGEPVSKPSVETGLIFQESRLFPWLSVEKNIEFGIHENMNNKEKKQLVQEYINTVQLTGFEKAYPAQLSGGMQQRVSIARTIINNPSVLLLDEPFGALDALTRINMQNAVLDIWQKHKTTMILITHDIDEAIFLSDKILVMSSRPGVISKEIPVRISKPRDRNGSDFISIRREIYSKFFEDSSIDIEYYI